MNAKIVQVYWNRRNFTTICREIYALFAAQRARQQKGKKYLKNLLNIVDK
jgi:hypothetical protein